MDGYPLFYPDNTMIHKFKITFLICFCVMVCFGCGRKLPPGMPKLYPATITVTYDDGKPVDSATVIFHPTTPFESGKFWVIAGITDAKGQAEVYTQVDYQGMPAGKYNVVVQKFIVEGTPPPSNPSMPMNAEQQQAYRDYLKSGKRPERFQLVENEYLDAAKTPLKDIEVKAGKNMFDLKVGKEQRIIVRSPM